MQNESDKFQIGEKVKVPVLAVVNESEIQKAYRTGEILKVSETVEDAFYLKVDLPDDKHCFANIKREDLVKID